MLVLFSTGGRGAIHVTLTDDLVRAGRKAGDLVNRIAALSGGKGAAGPTSPRPARATRRGCPPPARQRPISSPSGSAALDEGNGA